MSGWIKTHRDLQKHWIYNFDDPGKTLAWIDLLLSANYGDSSFMIKNTVVQVKRGQLAISQKTLQKRWNWSQNKLKRYLKLLKNERMIDFETNALTTIITICNYEDYQSKDEEGERPHERTDERPGERSPNDQANDIKEVKNIKNKTLTSSAEPNDQDLLGDDLKDVEQEAVKGPPPCPHQKIVDSYHKYCPALPAVKILSPDRKKKLQARWRESEKHQQIKFWDWYFSSVSKSDFLMGKKTDFKAGFDWLINSSNFVKVIENNYVNTTNGGGR